MTSITKSPLTLNLRRPTSYEGLVSTEKQVVIFDIGYCYTKLGFCGEPHPRFIIPTTVRNEDTGVTSKVLQYSTLRQLYDNLVQFLHYCYFEKLLVSPKDRKVVVVESLLVPVDFRETLAKVLFQHLEAASLLFVSSHMVSLYPLAVPSALVFDLGYEESVLIPVFEGYPVLHAYQAQPIAAKAVENNIRNLLLEYYKNKDISKVPLIEKLPDHVIEDIKVRLCFCTTLERSQKLLNKEDLKPPPSVEYPIKGEERITIDGTIRESACEVLFQLDAEQVSLPTMILDAILKCPVDMRKPLSENILLIGGSSMLTGIKSRIIQELNYLRNVIPKYKEKLFVEQFKFHVYPRKENYIAWFGGSIVGASEMVNFRSVLKEEYLEKKEIPDWVKLTYNTKQVETIRCS